MGQCGRAPGAPPYHRESNVASLVALSEGDGLSCRYDERLQSIALQIAPERLTTTSFDVQAEQEANDDSALALTPGRSAVLRYSLVASGEDRRDGLSYSGVSAAIDARFYDSGGKARQTLLVGHDGRGLRGLRLDTAWTKFDPARRRVWTVSDSITGATGSRPIRFAGLRIGHDFRTRPGLVTVPLPGVAGSAAVPSSLDVYIDGLKRYSTQVP